MLDLSADSGLLLWEAVRRTPEGGVWALVRTKEARQVLLEEGRNLPELRQPKILVGTPEDLPRLLQESGDAEVRFDFILGRNALGRLADRAPAWKILAALLEPHAGTLALAETLPKRGQRLSALLPEPAPQNIRDAEEKLYAQATDPLMNWDLAELLQEAQDAGLQPPKHTLLESRRTQTLTPGVLDRWMDPTQKGSYAARLLAAGLPETDLLPFAQELHTLSGKEATLHATVALLTTGRK